MTTPKIAGPAGSNYPQNVEATQEAMKSLQTGNFEITTATQYQAKNKPTHNVVKTAMKQNAEEGHAAPPPPDPKVEWQKKKDEFEAAKAANAPLDARIAELETQNKHINVLFQSAQLKGDGVITWKEVEWLAKHGSPEQQDAAKWMMANKGDFWDSMDKAWTALDVDGTANLNGEPVGRGVSWQGFQNKYAEMEGYIRDAKAQKKPVPADPGPAPGAASTASQAQTGTPGATGTDASQGTKDTKTPEQANADMFPSFSKLPKFSSSATTGEGRMLDASAHLQKSLDALEQDLAAAAAKGDQNAMTAINAKIAKFQAGMSALMQMMKQRQEMESNMSKMFSEMAMSSIRNMR